MSKKDTFPYKKKFIENIEYDLKEYFNNIINYKVKYNNPKLFSKFINYDVIIKYNDEDYYNINIFTDFFTEKQRMKARFFTEKYSPFDFYEKHKKKINDKFKHINNKNDRLYKMREYIYSNVKEASNFKITAVLGIMQYLKKNLSLNFNNLKILDPSSGWGDRLIAFTSLNVLEYIGFDPNTSLQKSYNKIINTITSFNNSNNHYEVKPFGFEYCNYKNYFDIVFTSPPYFNVEEYETNNNEQSNIKYNTLDKWKNKFFKKYIKNCVNAVKKNGLIFIHISDNKNFKIVDFLMDEMNKYNVIKYQWFGIEGTNYRCFPIWSWIKQ